MRTSRRTALALCGAVSALVALVACSSSGGSADGPANNNGSVGEIRVGAVGSYSGPLGGLLGLGKPTIEAWASSVNDAGGIDGRKIRLFVEDDHGDVSRSVTLIHKLVEKDHVVAIVGQASNGGDAAWASYVAGKGVPVIGGVNTDAPYITDPNFFDPVGNLIAGFYGIAQAAQKNGPNIGALYCAEAPACAQVAALLKGIGPATDVKLTYSNKVAASSADYTAACQGLIDAGVHSYDLSVVSDIQKRIATQCTQQGLKATLVTNVADTTYLDVPAFDGMQVVDPRFPFFDESLPATQQFHAALKKYQPSVGSASMPLGETAASVWAGGKLFEAAVKAGGDGPVTSASIKAGLYALHDETLGGLAPPLNFTQGKVALNNCYFEYTVKSGKFVLTNGMTPSCAPADVIDKIIAQL